MMHRLKRIVEQGRKVFVFMGEAGSGKSEIAVNWALMLAAAGRPVRFYDMDQTKPIFRSRELAELLQSNNILFEKQSQMLDAPVIPHGVLEQIREADCFTILDIGGNVSGTRAIGQFAEAWGSKVIAYLVINCYRPFSENQYSLKETIDSILSTSRFKNAGVISNPNFGEQTSLKDVIEGHKYLEYILRETRYNIELLTVPKALQTEVQNVFPCIDIFGIMRYIKAPWEKDEGD